MHSDSGWAQLFQSLLHGELHLMYINFVSHIIHLRNLPQVAAIPEGGGTHRLVAWDLLTLGVAWSAALPLAALAAEPVGGGGGGGSLVVAISSGCAYSF